MLRSFPIIYNPNISTLENRENIGKIYWQENIENIPRNPFNRTLNCFFQLHPTHVVHKELLSPIFHFIDLHVLHLYNLPLYILEIWREEA